MGLFDNIQRSFENAKKIAEEEEERKHKTELQKRINEVYPYVAPRDHIPYAKIKQIWWKHSLKGYRDIHGILMNISVPITSMKQYVFIIKWYYGVFIGSFVSELSRFLNQDDVILVVEKIAFDVFKDFLDTIEEVMNEKFSEEHLDVLIPPFVNFYQEITQERVQYYLSIYDPTLLYVQSTAPLLAILTFKNEHERAQIGIDISGVFHHLLLDFSTALKDSLK